jgi:phosphoribosylaminoimidazolecarboxamide formyltransferase / IMP cyclohydrolase
MTAQISKRRALLSVSDKTGLAAFARGLIHLGFELVSTGGTAASLEAAGVPVVAVADATGFPEMLDGRVKTLHPAIHGGILARRAHADDMAVLSEQGILPIDLVAVNLYPFEKAARDPSTPFDRLIEEIDIGGPSLVRAAAKNFADVLVVVSPGDYDAVLEELAGPGGPLPAFRFELAKKAFAHTAAYDGGIAETLSAIEWTPGGPSRGTPRLRAMLLRKVRDLRYGENPHQKAAWFAHEGPAGFGAASVVQGKELSFTNLLDLDTAARIVAEFKAPAAAVIKHTNPCGAATGTSAADAYVRARDADALSAFGGCVGVNRPIDEAMARALTSTFIEAVVAPAVEPSAASILAAKANMRVVVIDLAALAAAGDPDLRSIAGSVLVQDRDRVVEAADPWPGEGTIKVVTRRGPTDAEWTALRFAWRVCAHVKSNAVIFTNSERTLAIGAGQMSRVDAVKIAALKAAERGGIDLLSGSVAASDAFFPFRDGVDAVAAAGATAVVQPGGSVRDAEVIAAADEHRLAMVFTSRRHFRH